MSLSKKDKEAVKALWNKISKNLDAIGAEAFGRMLVVYPETKTYFSNWPDISFGSSQVKNHGKTVMSGFVAAVANIDDLTAGLKNLSGIHAVDLKVDPAKFKLLGHCLHVVTAMMFPKDFTPEKHAAFDKFLAALALALSENYR